MPRRESPQDDAFLTPELLQIAFESAGIAVWKVNSEQGGIDISSAMRRMLGVSIAPRIDYDDFFALIHPDDRALTRSAVDLVLRADGPAEAEAAFRLAGDRAEPARWFGVAVRATFSGDDRRCDGAVGTLRDITSGKKAEDALRDALERQRELLHDVNHRVKNSLQLVSSLLRLQSRRAPDAETRRQLDAAMTRISTIAHIHQRLYRDQDNARIRFGSFVNELCADLQGVAPRCSLEVKAEDISIPTDKAISLALIINELVGNAFEYAYPAGGGPVSVALEDVGDGTIRITVADRGVGLPEGFEVETCKTLGMTLIAGMVKQLKGGIEARRAAPGAAFVLTAPIPAPD